MTAATTTTGTLREHALSPSVASNPDRRPLSVMDQIIWAVDAGVRATGGAGFETQTIVWLDRQVDIGGLKSALDAFAKRYPVVTSHLERARLSGKLSWRFRPDRECVLQERWLHSANESEVWQCAAELLSRPRDLYADAPIDFHVLHLPDERDVLLMQYNHTLMDNPAAILVLREIDRLSRDESDDATRQELENCDQVQRFLAVHSRWERLAAAWRTVSLRVGSLRSDIGLFGGEASSDVEPNKVRILAAELSADEVREITKSVVERCHVPGLSMALLASVLRAGQLTELADIANCRFTTGIGLELGLRSDDGPLFQNLSSVVPIVVGQNVENKEQLTSELNSQLRDRLRQRIDFGVVELGALFYRQQRFMKFAMRRLMRYGYSVWFAHFGPSDPIGDQFLNASIQHIRFVGPSWPSAGITVITNQFAGRLNVQLTYTPACISDATAKSFLNAFLQDLRSWQS